MYLVVRITWRSHVVVALVACVVAVRITACLAITANLEVSASMLT
jgi:hypothetical protein